MEDGGFIGDHYDPVRADAASHGHHLDNVRIHFLLDVLSVGFLELLPGNPFQQTLPLYILLEIFPVPDHGHGHGGILVIDAPGGRDSGGLRHIVVIVYRPLLGGAFAATRPQIVISCQVLSIGIRAGYPLVQKTRAFHGQAVLMPRHAVGVSVVGVIFRHFLLVIGKVNGKMAAHFHLVELFRAQQHLLHLVRHHGFGLNLQFLHGTGDSHGGIVVPAREQQIGVLVYDRNGCRAPVAQGSGGGFRHGRSVGRVEVIRDRHRERCEGLRIGIAQPSGIGGLVDFDIDALYRHCLGEHALQLALQVFRLHALTVCRCDGHAHLHHILIGKAVGHIPFRGNRHVRLCQLGAQYVNRPRVRGFPVGDSRVLQNRYDFRRRAGILISSKPCVLRPAERVHNNDKGKYYDRNNPDDNCLLFAGVFVPPFQQFTRYLF